MNSSDEGTKECPLCRWKRYYLIPDLKKHCYTTHRSEPAKLVVEVDKEYTTVSAEGWAKFRKPSPWPLTNYEFVLLIT